jgi:hypothetical protein
MSECLINVVYAVLPLLVMFPIVSVCTRGYVMPKRGPR